MPSFLIERNSGTGGRRRTGCCYFASRSHFDSHHRLLLLLGGRRGGQGHLSGVMEGEDNEGRQAYPMRRVDDLATRRGERIRSAISSFCPATHQHMSVCVHTEEKKEISTHLGYVASAEGHTMYRKTINKIKGETLVARRTARY